MWAMLRPAWPVLTCPTYSSISFGGSPAAATRLGSRISSGMIASIPQDRCTAPRTRSSISPTRPRSRGPRPAYRALAPLFVTLGAGEDDLPAQRPVIEGFWGGLAKRSVQLG